MTVSPSLAAPTGLSSRAIAPAAATLAFGLVAITAGFALTDPRGLRALLAVSLIMVFAGVGFLTPRQLLFALVVWLTSLGFLRRLVSEWSPAGATDVLLLVGPAAIVVLFLLAIRRGAFRNRSTFANALLVLSLLILLEAVNPLQRNLIAGVAALLFVLVPTMGFWIGRVLCDDRTLKRVLVIVALFSVAEAFYGLLQSFRGFPTWDSAWISTHEQQYAALYVGNVIRPFASFSSAAEYSFYLAFGLLVWVAVAARRSRLFGAAAALLLATAIFYASGRGIVVLLVAAAGLAVAARRGLPLAFAGATAAAFLALVPFVAGYFNRPGSESDAAPTLVSHQVGGLANPFDPQQSSLGAHFTLMKFGVVSAFHHPLGQGIEGVTIAGSKFGGSSQITEADPSNIGVALGVPGLLLYLIVLGAGFLQAYRLAVARRDALALVALAITTVMVLQWFNGGQYSVALMLWLVVGWIDRKSVIEKLESVLGQTSDANAGRAR